MREIRQVGRFFHHARLWIDQTRTAHAHANCFLPHFAQKFLRRLGDPLHHLLGRIMRVGWDGDFFQHGKLLAGANDSDLDVRPTDVDAGQAIHVVSLNWSATKAAVVYPIGVFSKGFTMAESSKKLGAAIFGAGWVAGEHARAYQACARTKLVAVGSRKLESARKCAQAANAADAFITTDFDALLKRPEVDLISITTPPDTHPDLTIRAAR